MDSHVRASGGQVDELNLSNWISNNGSFTGDKQLYDFANFSIFGAGGRMCIGYKFAMDELLVFLLNVLHGYDFEVTKSEKVVFPFAFWKVTAQFMQRQTVFLG